MSQDRQIEKMASNAGKVAVRQVKPLLSLDKSEAKRRVLNLYKAWYRHIPYACKLVIIFKYLPQ